MALRRKISSLVPSTHLKKANRGHAGLLRAAQWLDARLGDIFRFEDVDFRLGLVKRGFRLKTLAAGLPQVASRQTGSTGAGHLKICKWTRPSRRSASLPDSPEWQSSGLKTSLLAAKSQMAAEARVQAADWLQPSRW
jgi:hypothetical protein